MNASDTLFNILRMVNASSNGDEIYEVCFETPPRIVSDGIWGSSDNGFGRTPMRSSLTVFQLQVLVIFSLTYICHLFFKHLGFPILVSQMMAGLILGPTLEIESLNLIHYKKMLFPYGSQDTLAAVSSLGYALLMFLTSVQMDLTMIARTGNRVWSIALMGLAIPLMIGLICVSYVSESLKNSIGPIQKDLNILVASHSITSFAVVACFLIELKIINSELGRLALSAALVSDTTSLSLSSILTALGDTVDNKLNWASLAIFCAFVILIPLVSRPTMNWMIKRTPEGRPVKHSYIFFILAVALGLGWVSVKLKQQFIVGPIILGMSVPDGPPLGTALVKKIQLFGLWFLLPIFVTTCVMRVDFSLEYSASLISVSVAFIILTHIVKIAVRFVVCVCCKMPFTDALSLALILNYQGAVEVCLYNGLYDEKNITGQTYAILMLSTMVISSVVQMTLKHVYDPSRKYVSYHQRNIMNLKETSELKLVVCIHKQSHISCITDFLDICYPTEENPITVDALHLIELIGRAVPIFISHRQMGAPGAYRSCSDGVIRAFDLYENENPDASINVYTAMSPPSFMHEDVCNLALDKLASMIILPFHQRWSLDGNIEYNDKNIRSINLKVLERAPCSVGILMSRASLKKRSSRRLAMVFLGGDDDREALSLAKRATRDPMINLVVYHLIAENRAGTSNLENILDKQVLKSVRQEYPCLNNVTYREIPSNDGTDTTSFLRAVAHGHDLFIVGRRHGVDTPQTSGITSWSEFSELGGIGDFLASSDYGGSASVLVVQQQASHTQKKWRF